MVSLTPVRAPSNVSSEVVCESVATGGHLPSGTGRGPADPSDSFQINRDYSFLDYIPGGCQLMFTVRLTPPPPPHPSMEPP